MSDSNNFGTLKDDSLLINTVASNICLYHGNVFQNGIKPFSKMVNHCFAKKNSKLCIFPDTILFKFHQHVVQIVIK